MYNKRYLEVEGIKYIENSLDLGKTLSFYLKKNNDLYAGNVYSFLPVNSIKNANDLDSGNIFSYKSKSIINKEKQLKSEKKLNMNFILADIIEKYLYETNDAIVLFEDEISLPNDKWILEKSPNIFVYKNEIYYPLEPFCAQKRILKNILYATSWLLVGVFSQLKRENKVLENKTSIDDKMLDEITKNTNKIIIGAYDMESFLIWEKKGGR